MIKIVFHIISIENWKLNIIYAILKYPNEKDFGTMSKEIPL